MTILLIEEQTMIRELLALACSQSMPFAEICVADNGSAALVTCRYHRPGVVIIGMELSDRDGFDLLYEIAAGVPEAKVIVLSSRIDQFTLHRALRAPVHGIVDKNESLKIFREAITTVLTDRKFVSPGVQQLQASVRADPVAFHKILSEREQEVLRLVGGGLDNRQIAQLLRISPSTAKHHRTNIMAKLDRHSTPKLIHYAIEKGFTRIAEGGEAVVRSSGTAMQAQAKMKTLDVPTPQQGFGSIYPFPFKRKAASPPCRAAGSGMRAL